MYLRNIYQDYRKAPLLKRSHVIREYVRAIRSTHDAPDFDFAQARTQLLPKIRERYYHQVLKLMSLTEGNEKLSAFPVRVFSDDLTVELVLDHPKAVSIVNQKTLDDWKISFDDALKIARENLWQISKADFQELAPGVYFYPAQDTHDASRLFLHDLIWQLKVQGDHIAMVPERTALLVTGSENAEGLLQMATVTERLLQEQTRPMSGVAVRLEGEHWKRWLPRESHPAYWPLKRCAMRSTMMAYGEQKAMLEKLAAKQKEDVFVASHSVIQRDSDNTWFSWTSWVDGVTNALMPEADWVFFGREKHNEGAARFEVVKAQLGHLMEQTDDYPPRYRIRTFPSPEQLAQLSLRPINEL
jgi:hypothetical protein